ncbi:hypothetical protein AB0M46_30435 [Dactylosporangium sp. NPDC051485]|uniref:hypothetical protein n=1 Tax=Dactylosporangium sp. NPDC051485 TaxID=3154846 RepID=UPI00341FFC9E
MTSGVRRRIGRRLGGLLGVGGLLATLLFWPLPPGKSEFDTGCDPVRLPKVGAAAPVGNGLVADERGFSIIEQPTIFSLGASVLSRSAKVAYHTTVWFRLVAAGGGVIWEGKPHELSVIRPGQRVSVGEVADVYYSYEAIKVVGVAVVFGTTHWVQDDPRNRLMQMTFDSTFATYERETNSALISYGPVFPYGCQGLALRHVAYVFRDTRGVVIGGSTRVQGKDLDACNGMHLDTSIWIGMLPDGVDLGQSRRTTYCDIAA